MLLAKFVQKTAVKELNSDWDSDSQTDNCAETHVDLLEFTVEVSSAFFYVFGAHVIETTCGITIKTELLASRAGVEANRTAAASFLLFAAASAVD